MIPESYFASTLRELLTPVGRWLDDQTVSEVLINGHDAVFVERGGRLERVTSSFASEAALLSALRTLAQYAGRAFDPEHPILEARMPDGSRVEAVHSSIAAGGTHVAIRRFSPDPLTVARLVELRSLCRDSLALLRACVMGKQNILVSGGTGTGKTSLLNALSGLVPHDERVVVLEDARELQPRGAHVVRLETRPADARGRGAVSMRDLFKATLRLRPDRIVVGEIRDGAALELIQAMTSGHGGCLSTLHASHPLDALHRLETMALMTELALPLSVLRSQIASGVDIIVQVERWRSGARVVTRISEVQRLTEAGDYRLCDLMLRDGAHDAEPGDMRPTGHLPAFAKQLEREGLGLPVSLIQAARQRKDKMV